jgi:hypothetical protein
MQGIILLDLINIITNKKPNAIADIICNILSNKLIALPLNKLIICPNPKVILETIIAIFILSLHIALNKKPLKIISSKSPTNNIVIK